MSIRTIKILHVEDEESQRRLFAHHLWAMQDLDFEIAYADAEEVALAVFETGEVEFVILDDHLREGNGLHCLKELRERDPNIPIIAISGVATDEVASEIVRAGANDYISKRALTSGVLSCSLREALAHADASREHRGGSWS